MLRVKQASKRKAQTKAVTVLGVAGALSLAGGAPGVRQAMHRCRTRHRR